MKQIICTILLTIVALYVSAQERETVTKELPKSLTIEFGTKKPKEEGYHLGADFLYKYLILGGGYGFTESENDKFKAAQRFDFHLGGNYRYYFLENMFYIEGRLLVGYRHYFQKYLAGVREIRHETGFGRVYDSYSVEEDIWKTYGKGNMYVGASPRIGMDVGGITLVAGYRWDFMDFKFDKEHKSDFFTVGLEYAF